MTRQRNDEHSTELGLWLRADVQESTIGSRLGYRATNIDYVWDNYKTGHFFHLEEKRYMARPTPAQLDVFLRENDKFKEDPKYHGFYIIRFEKTDPDDGKLFLSRVEHWKKDFEEWPPGTGHKRCFTTLADSSAEKEISKTDFLRLLTFTYS